MTRALREDLHVNNLLGYEHCPFGEEGFKSMFIPIWTIPTLLDVYRKKLSKMFITSLRRGIKAILDNVHN